MKTARRVMALCALAFTIGCGPRGYIRATITSTLRIPDQIDAMRVTISADADDAPILAEDDYALEGRAFPLRVVFEPDGDAPRQVRLVATVSLGETLVASTTSRFTWRDANVNEVVLNLP